MAFATAAPVPVIPISPTPVRTNRRVGICNIGPNNLDCGDIHMNWYVVFAKLGFVIRPVRSTN